MSSRRLSMLFLVPFLVTSVAPVPAMAFMRVPTSLASDSERAGPIIPEFGYKKKQKKLTKQKARKKAAKKVDPMKAIRNRMVAGKKVSDKELRRLADSGDDLGQFHYAKRLEERGDPEVIDTAATYYLKALAKDRTAAERPLIRLLDGGTLAEEAELIADAEAILGERAADGDAVAREALIRMYRDGAPFGLEPEKADALLVAAADGGDARAALDLAYAMLRGVPAPDQIEAAKSYLEIAATAEDLSIRTQAENILRGLEPGQPQILNVASEASN